MNKNKLVNNKAKYSSICDCCGDCYDAEFALSLKYCEDCRLKKTNKHRFLGVNFDRLVNEVNKELEGGKNE